MNKNAPNKEKSETKTDIIKEGLPLPEQKNGFVNGVVTHASATKKSKKKKHKNSVKSVENSVVDKQVEAEDKQSDIVHTNVKENLDAKLDSNENISREETIESMPVPSCSTTELSTSKSSPEKELDISKELDDLELACNKQVVQPKIEIVQYQSEEQMPMIMKIIQKDLSEPYSIYTYRYFIHNWPNLCFLAMCEGECVGAIVCKLDLHRKVIKRGYIAMLAVDQNYRKLRIGSTLVQMAIQEMIIGDADEVVLETEVTNKPALQLYEKLGFVRDKRLFRYYLNGVDALRLKLWLR